MADEIKLFDNGVNGEEYSSPKKVRSVILATAEEDGWVSVDEKLPEIDETVMIRIVDDNKVYGYFRDDPDCAIAAEDAKLGYYVKDPDTHEVIWRICPPHPKYDYSPLSKRYTILDGARVSHWKPVKQEEIDDYENRFNIVGKYHTLKLVVDPEHEELVYRSLLWGATFIGDYLRQTQESDKDVAEFTKLYNVLCDLQCTIDRGCCIVGGVEKKSEPVYMPSNVDTSADENPASEDSPVE